MATSTLTVSTSFPEGHGDFKLISSDGVTFHFPRYLLCLMSPSFEGMFDVIGNDAQPQELNMVENSTTVDQFLRFLDPRMKVLPLDFETVAPLLETARKYEVPKILEWWEEQVVVKVDGIAPDKTSLRKPMACLALASRFDLPNTARLAFRDLVKAPSKDLITDIRFESQLFITQSQLTVEVVTSPTINSLARCGLSSQILVKSPAGRRSTAIWLRGRHAPLTISMPRKPFSILGRKRSCIVSLQLVMNIYGTESKEGHPEESDPTRAVRSIRSSYTTT